MSKTYRGKNKDKRDEQEKRRRARKNKRVQQRFFVEGSS